MRSTERLRDSAPLWGALLLSAGAWSVHLIVGQFAVEAVCAPVADTRGAGQVHPTLWIALLLTTAVTFALALAGTIYAWVRRSSLEQGRPGLERAADLSPVIVGASAFFALLILVESVPLLIIACGRAT